MKAVIPVAGIGTRLRPQTFTIPKALLNVAGKPILGHILDSLLDMGVTELIPIIGYKGELIREYMSRTYDVPTHFVVQKEQKGIAHAISLARSHADESELIIILGDTIIKTDFTRIPETGDYVLGVHEVGDPQRFGVCEVEGGVITSIVEKPEKPTSNLAVVGLYYMRDSTLLFEACAELIGKSIMTKGEYQITDALQLMIERGAEFHPYVIDGWFDCGKLETLLETNRVLLDDMNGDCEREGSIIIPPCYIDQESEIDRSIIGPYVSVARGCRISDSIVRDSILNEGSALRDVMLEGSVVGAFAEVTGARSSYNISDYSQIDFR
ncbi:MAG TPA: sugar phosphate nucleotidyltransferase [Patescibacteria group bacterium]|nr:sugar phosphate nucleotidyltransferase [Patescibacteria group bacterium]